MIRVWDVESGQEVQTIDSGTKKVRNFLLTPDGRQLFAVVSDSRYDGHSTVGDETLQVWEIESGEKLRELHFKSASTESMVLAEKGKRLITGTANGMIHLIDTESGREVAVLPGHQHSVDSLVSSHDGKLLASGSVDQTIRIWDAENWKLLRVLKGHQRAVTSVAFSPHSHVLVSGSGKRSYPLSPENPHKIRIWDADSGEELHAFSGHDVNTSALAFAPDGNQIVTAHDNTTLLAWDVSQIDRR